MIPGLTSIIIPCFNHAEFLPDAIGSALAQTAPVEVIVVDDGSTDGTFDLLHGLEQRDDARFGFMRIDHRGPAAARNCGIERADGEFVMFLDADDVIAPNKVARQIAEMLPDTGFVLCDVRIEDADGRVELASHRYAYRDKALDGWIAPVLEVANFIPIMSPLIRREALGDIRFPLDRHPEDWPFLLELARVARCRYVPDVLATYRKRRGGRNAARALGPPVAPLRLNLGCGDPNAASWHPLPGFVNLDKALGWRFEDGLAQYADGSVAGITISHALMYVAVAEWPRVFAEFARVLEPGGIVRITEDNTIDPASRTFPNGWRDAVTLTGPGSVAIALAGAGFRPQQVDAGTTCYRDRSLCQSFHGEAPHVFYVEGVRECSVLFTPHSDDETLFAAFTIIRHKPRVVICFPSSGDYGDTATRTAESREAVAILGGGPVDQWNCTGAYGVEPIEEKMRELDAQLRPTLVWAPSPNTTHPEHLLVARAANAVFAEKLDRGFRQFHTYRDAVKVRTGAPVAFEQEWIERKRAALACYRTQLAHPRARIFFDDDLAEYAP